ncbi:MAG TPA: ISL3 family transposase, partial [Actinomycetota bacterium]|nr:ISL3 family transposase [Actinomycetota bacterium]
METNATRMCELLVGLPDVTVLAVDDQLGATIVVHIESRPEPAWCEACAVRARVKERPVIGLIDLPCFGRPARLVWRKHRRCCPE